LQLLKIAPKEFSMKTTKVRSALCATLLIALSATAVLAADVTGRWTKKDKDPRDGSAVKATYVFIQEGAKLTGRIEISGGDEETSNLHGKVDENKISFTVTFSDATYTLSGAIEGDGMKLTMTSDDPNFPAHDVTLKRSTN
jgi:hypothetical protein